MALTSADLARLGPQAQKQVLDKLAGAQKPKKANTETARSCATESSLIPSVRRRGSAS